MDALDLAILNAALPVGSDNGTTVRALAEDLAWNERHVRKGIQQLRRDLHVPVVTSEGVFIATPDDLDALKHTRDSLHSRAMSLHVTVRDLDECIADIEWSPTLFAEVA